MLILIRHGQTQHNLEHRYQGHNNTSLNETGRAQAHRCGELLANVMLSEANYRNQKKQFFCSDLNRASETADIIYNTLTARLTDQHVDLKHTATLREYHVGLFQGLTRTEFEKKYPELSKIYFDERVQNPYSTRPPGEQAETSDDVAKRLLTFLSEIKNQHLDKAQSNCINIVVSHGWTLTTLLELLDAIPTKPSFEAISNCEMLIVSLKDKDHNNFTPTHPFALRHSCPFYGTLVRRHKVAE